VAVLPRLALHSAPRLGIRLGGSRFVATTCQEWLVVTPSLGLSRRARHRAYVPTGQRGSLFVSRKAASTTPASPLTCTATATWSTSWSTWFHAPASRATPGRFWVSVARSRPPPEWA